MLQTMKTENYVIKTTHPLSGREYQFHMINKIEAEKAVSMFEECGWQVTLEYYTSRTCDELHDLIAEFC